jgi:CRISPR system Cascade subunit CasD
MKTILLKLAGPMQSWGTSSRFETRHTDRYPSKSAVTGILAASCGFSRDDSRVKKLGQLDFAVRVDQPGELLADFHVARRLKPDGTLDQAYVTNRYYLQDAVFVVALGGSDEEWMDDLENALRHPYFQPYLGRRSNPLNADFFLGTQKKDVITCLEELPWQASDWYRSRQTGRVVLPIYADAHLLGGSPRQMVRDSVVTFSQRERRHGYRTVGRKDVVFLSTGGASVSDHDAFNAV